MSDNSRLVRTGKDVVSIIRKKVEEAEENGAQAISSGGLKALLAAIYEDIPANPERDHAFDLAYYNVKAEGKLEEFRSIISTAVAAIQSLMLLNGGSAVAVFAFIGHLVASGGTTFIPKFAIPLSAFVIGAACSSLFAVCVCGAQKAFHMERNWVGKILVGLCVLAIIGSFAAFGYGVWAGYQALAILGTMSPAAPVS